MNTTSILSRQMTYALLPGKFPPMHLNSLYEKAYECWKDVWREAFQELEGNPTVYSNDFTRQDEVSALYYKDTCIGTTFFNWLDLNSPPSRDDEYFKVWTPKALSELTRHGSRILVCSYFTLHPNGRRNSLGVSLKDVLMGLLVKRFLDTDAPAMTGTVRNNRGVNVCTYRHGAVPLELNLKLHGVDVDLIAFYRDTAKVGDDPIVSDLVESLWNRRITSDRFSAGRYLKVA
jgi:hypothetical protein